MKHGTDYEEICNDLADEFAVRVRFDYCTQRILKYSDKKCNNCPFYSNTLQGCHLKILEKTLRTAARYFGENDVINGGEI